MTGTHTSSGRRKPFATCQGIVNGSALVAGLTALALAATAPAWSAPSQAASDRTPAYVASLPTATACPMEANSSSGASSSKAAVSPCCGPIVAPVPVTTSSEAATTTSTTTTTRAAGAASRPSTRLALVKLPSLCCPSGPLGPSGASASAVDSGSAPALPCNVVAARRFLEAQLAARTRQLSKLTDAVGRSGSLTGTNRDALDTMLLGETSGIHALAAQLPVDSTLAELRAAETSMVAYRVYAVMTPQVHITISADAVLASSSDLSGREASIAGRIAGVKAAHPKAASIAERLFERMTSEVQQASNTAGGVPGPVLATTPADYPANKTIFVQADANIASASRYLVVARRLVDEIDIVITF